MGGRFAALCAVLLISTAAYAGPPPVSWPEDDHLLLVSAGEPVPVIVANAGDIDSQLAAVERALKAFRLSGKLRRLGEAQALLDAVALGDDSAAAQRWRSAFLRSQLLQSQHRFEEADQQLRVAAALLPELDDKPQQLAMKRQWLLAAYHLSLVQGKYTQAQQHCKALSSSSSPLYSRGCALYLQAVVEQSTEAYRQLTALLSGSLLRDGVALHWLAVSRADVADRLAPDEALPAWRMALALSPADRYSQSRYCDAALAADNPSLALGISAEKTDDEALLICRLVALHRLGEELSPAQKSEAGQLQATLEQRLDEAQRRGAGMSARHHARYLLDVLERPVPALVLAEENWAQQREWPDQQLLARARAAQEPGR